MTNRLRIRPAHQHDRRYLVHSLAVAALAISTVPAAAGCDEETRPGPNTRAEQQLQLVLDGSVAKPGVMLPGAIAHYHSPAYRPWSGAAGKGDVPAGVAMRPHDQFRAGSVLKTFLATVTLQHVEEGTLSLEAKLPALLPETVTSRIANADEISLRMLLNHTSGIPDWVTSDVSAAVIADPLRVWSPDEAIEIASRMPPTFAPGTSWSYSNTNYTVIGMVLDGVGGKSWRAQVRQRVLERIGLSNTHLPEPGDATMVGDYAHGYQEWDGAVVDLSAVDPSMAGAAGGHALVTTAQDLGHFLEALLAGELFAQPATLAAMTTMIDAPHESGLPHRYGFALEEFTLPSGTTVIGHAGSTAGYAVMMFRIPASDATLVTAVNTSDLFVNALEVFMPAVDAITASAPLGV
jgi:D-alanyl-D-alanine carboxypeptidase